MRTKQENKLRIQTSDFYREIVKFCKFPIGFFIKQIYQKLLNEVMKYIEELKCQSSGWIIENFNELTVKFLKSYQLKALLYTSLPDWYSNNKFVLININHTGLNGQLR